VLLLAQKFDTLCALFFFYDTSLDCCIISNIFVGQALVDNDYQDQNGPIPNMQNPSWPNPTAAGGMS